MGLEDAAGEGGDNEMAVSQRLLQVTLVPQNGVIFASSCASLLHIHGNSFTVSRNNAQHTGR